MKKTILLLSTLTLLFGLFSCSSDDSGNGTANPIENPVDEQPNPSDPIVGTWKVETTKYFKESELVIESESACPTIKDYWIIKENNVFSSTFHYSDCDSQTYEDVGTWNKENGSYTILFEGSQFEILEINSSKIILKYDGIGTFYDNNDNPFAFDYYTIELKK